MRRAPAWLRFTRVAVPLGLVWLGLNGSDLASWLVGAPALLVASLVVTRFPHHRPLALRWTRLPRFALFFVHQSVLGGWDVARRVLERHPRVKPGYVDYETSLPGGPARHFYIGVISLLPGTLTTDVEGDRIVVHTIDVDSDPRGAIGELEAQVSRIFSDSRSLPS
jgi:multicomponent Na+:H+ antiporter subunit E